MIFFYVNVNNNPGIKCEPIIFKDAMLYILLKKVEQLVCHAMYCIKKSWESNSTWK